MGEYFPFVDMGELVDVGVGGSQVGGRQRASTRRRSRTERGGDLFTTVFFFEGGRGHTRFDCDWSSDVCSSDLSRMPDKPASTLLHLGPGLANSAANLHNAKKAGSGIVNIVGEHALYHIQYDTPLTTDIEGIARPFSHWVKTSPTSKTVAADGALAIQAARVAPGQIATLILPADTAWGEADGVADTPDTPAPTKPRNEDVVAAAKALKQGNSAM